MLEGWMGIDFHDSDEDEYEDQAIDRHQNDLRHELAYEDEAEQDIVQPAYIQQQTLVFDETEKIENDNYRLILMQEEGIDETWIEDPLFHLEKLTLFLGVEELEITFDLTKTFVTLLLVPSLASFVGHQIVLYPVFKLSIEILMTYSLTATLQVILKTFWIPRAQVFSHEVKITMKDAFYF